MNENNRTEEQKEFQSLYYELSRWMTKNEDLVGDVNRYIGTKKGPIVDKMKAWAERVSKLSTTWHDNLEAGTTWPEWAGGKRTRSSRSGKTRKQKRRRSLKKLKSRKAK